jgi:hypothetical protein
MLLIHSVVQSYVFHELEHILADDTKDIKLNILFALYPGAAQAA